MWSHLESESSSLTGVLFSVGFAYIYSGPVMLEYSMWSKRLFRLLDNSYFLTCTNF